MLMVPSKTLLILIALQVLIISSPILGVIISTLGVLEHSQREKVIPLSDINKIDNGIDR